MVDVLWAAGGGTSWSASGNIRGPVPMPLGRADANGDGRCLVVSLRAFVSGRGATRAGQIVIENTYGTPVFNVGASSAGQDVGYIGCDHFLASGGAAEMELKFGGAVFFGKSGSGSITDGASSWPNLLGGGLQYVQSPSQCGAPNIVPSADGTSALIVIAPPADNGSSAINAYALQRANDPGFTVNVATTIISDSATFTGLTPGQRYYWRSAARNLLTDSTGSIGGPWSAASTAVQPKPARGRLNLAGSGWGGLLSGKINPGGSAWVPLDGKINVDGTAWVPLGS